MTQERVPRVPGAAAAVVCVLLDACGVEAGVQQTGLVAEPVTVSGCSPLTGSAPCPPAVVTRPGQALEEGRPLLHLSLHVFRHIAPCACLS